VADWEGNWCLPAAITPKIQKTDMFGTEIIEVGIGLAFAYFAISIICSGIVELGVKLTKLRAKHMKMALGKLLDDKNYNGFVGELYKHHLITSPFKDRLGDPTSITSKNFAIAVMEILGKNDKLSEEAQFKLIKERILTIKDPATKDRMLSILNSSANQFDTMRAKIENWFNDSMEGVTEWYRQRMRTWVTIVSFVVVGIANADTVKMATMFWNDDELRSATVQAAQGYSNSLEARMSAPVPAAPTAPVQTVDTVQGVNGDSLVVTTSTVASADSLQTMNDLISIKTTLDTLYKDINATKVLPIGWASEILPGKPGWDKSKDAFSWWLMKIIGLILTVGAVSLGSTYWYKQLQSLLRLRFGKSEPAPTPVPEPAPPTSASTDQSSSAQNGEDADTDVLEESTAGEESEVDENASKGPGDGGNS
jgi:hypothetical protein